MNISKQKNISQYLLLCSLFFSSVLCAQIQYSNVRFKQLGLNEGLSQSTVYSITQDSQGFMWFATRSGLCRYDGYQVKQFVHHDSDSTSLSHNIVVRLFSDSINHKVWASTDNGLCAYNQKTGSFTTYHLKHSNSEYFSMVQTPSGQFLIGGGQGIYSYEPTHDNFTPYLLLKKGSIKQMVLDQNKNLWLISSNHLLCYNMHTQTFVQLPSSIDTLTKNCSQLHYIAGYGLFINSKEGMWAYNPETETLHPLSHILQSTYMKSTGADINGHAWIGTEKGIYVINRSYSKVAYYKRTSSDHSGLNDNSINSIFRDKHDNMWVGTYWGGVNYFIYGTDQFKILPFGHDKDYLSGKAIRNIINTSDNQLLIAMEDGGINAINQDDSIIRKKALEKQLHMQLPTNNIHSLLLSDDNQLWIGTLGHGVTVYDRNKHKVIDFSLQKPQKSSAFCMADLGEHNILYGGPSGLFLANSERETVKKRKHIFVFCLLRANENTIWIGSRNNGLFTYDIKSDSVSKLIIKPLRKKHITSMYQDRKKNIWIGTNNHGLYLVDSLHQVKAHYTAANLGSNVIKSIIEDQYGLIWVGTHHGLISINQISQTINRYTVADGLPVNQFNYTAACKDKEGKLYFGTINGLLSFSPSKVKLRKPDFHIALTGVSSMNNVENRYNPEIEPFPDGSNHLTLKHKQAQSLNVKFSGMNFQYAKQAQYKMLMKSINHDWQFMGNQRQVHFSNLTDGLYQLKIQASSDGIHWDKKGMKTLVIEVLPPWWLTWWAYCIYLLIATIIILIIYRYMRMRLALKLRLANEHTQRLNMEKLNQQKSNLFTYISHDLKTPLTLILSPLYSLMNKESIQKQDRDIINLIYKNANRMHYLIDELMTISKIEMKQMEISVRKGDIIHFIREVAELFYVEADNLDLRFDVDLQETGIEVWFSHSHIERILFNLLTNSFKYTKAGGYIKLSAHIVTEDKHSMVIISVKDSGRGIPQENQKRIFEPYYQVDNKDNCKGYGIGLSLTKSLVEMHKGYIEVKSELGQGSNFIVTLNVSELAYPRDQRQYTRLSTEEMKHYTQNLMNIKSSTSGQETTCTNNNMDTILIVEDNREMNAYLCDLFRSKYKVLPAYDGIEAIQYIEKQLPDFIISDVMMPKMNGLELLSKIRNNILTSHIRVILLTAKTDETELTEGYATGADAYITKPFNPEHLLLLIENMVNSRRLVIEHFKKSQVLNITKLTTNLKDEQFMRELIQVIQKNIANPEFAVNDVLNELLISRTSLHSKLKALTGCSITQFIRSMRMKEAQKHLQNGMNVSETTFAVGLSDPNYFTKCFKKEFDLTPTEYIKKMESSSPLNTDN